MHVTTFILQSSNLEWEAGRSQKLKQVPQSFMKVFDVDDVTLTS